MNTQLYDYARERARKLWAEIQELLRDGKHVPNILYTAHDEMLRAMSEGERLAQISAVGPGKPAD
jgi:hypothetical protein